MSKEVGEQYKCSGCGKVQESFESVEDCCPRVPKPVFVCLTCNTDYENEERALDCCTGKLTDKQIDKIAESMPGGMDGFLKGWGWRQFARAIEQAHGIGVR